MMRYGITVEIEPAKLDMDADGYISRKGTIQIKWDESSMGFSFYIPTHLTKAAALRYILRKTGISLRQVRIE